MEKSIVMILGQDSQTVRGTGFYVGGSRLIVTCQHVFEKYEKGKSVQICLEKEHIFSGILSDIDEENDLALIKVDEDLDVNSFSEYYDIKDDNDNHKAQTAGYDSSLSLKDQEKLGFSRNVEIIGFRDPDIQITNANTICKGFSGAPLWSDGILLGMIRSFPNSVKHELRGVEDAFAIPARKIAEFVGGAVLKQVEKIDNIQDETSRDLKRILHDASMEPDKTIDRFAEYRDRWQDMMFLNDDSLDPVVMPVKLCDMYQMPHYSVYSRRAEQEIIYSNLDEYIASSFVSKQTRDKLLLVIGMPGIGKSTLLTWIVNHPVTDRQIIVMRAPDFVDELKTKYEAYYKKDFFFDSEKGFFSENVNSSEHVKQRKVLDKLLSIMLNGLGVSGVDIATGRISLLIDGLDEIGSSSLGLKLLEWFKQSEFLKTEIPVIITCRENFIDRYDELHCKYIKLKPFDENQIRTFASNYFCQLNREAPQEGLLEKLIGNKDIYGIPLILYMVLALDIDLEKAESIVDVYDRIFDAEGGIYKRSIQKLQYGVAHKLLSEKEMISHAHQLSKDIAFWIFENEAENEYYPTGQLTPEQQEIFIGTYFRLLHHCEGQYTEQTRFIHRSMYEYFTVLYICDKLEKSLIRRQEEAFCKALVSVLSRGRLYDDPNLIEYLACKLKEIVGRVSDTKGLYAWYESCVNHILEKGGVYYRSFDDTDNPRKLDDIICSEYILLSNIIVLLRVLNSIINKVDYVDTSGFSRNLSDRLKRLSPINSYPSLFFDNFYFENFELDFCRLAPASFEYTIIKNCTFEHLKAGIAFFRNSKLSDSSFQKIKVFKIAFDYSTMDHLGFDHSYLGTSRFQSSVLNNINFKCASLTSAIFLDATLHTVDFSSAELQGADFTGAVLNNITWSDDTCIEYAHFDKNHITEDFKYMKFSTIYVDGNEYSRDEFMKEFFPEDQGGN